MDKQNSNNNESKKKNTKKKPQRKSGTQNYNNGNKILLEGFKNQEEERISEPEYRTMEITQSREQKAERLKKDKQCLEACEYLGRRKDQKEYVKN